MSSPSGESSLKFIHLTLHSPSCPLHQGLDDKFLPKKISSGGGKSRQKYRQWMNWEDKFKSECYQNNEHPSSLLRKKWAGWLTEERIRRMSWPDDPFERLYSSRVDGIKAFKEAWRDHYNDRLKHWFSYKNRRASEAKSTPKPEWQSEASFCRVCDQTPEVDLPEDIFKEPQPYRDHERRATGERAKKYPWMSSSIETQP